MKIVWNIMPELSPALLIIDPCILSLCSAAQRLPKHKLFMTSFYKLANTTWDAGEILQKKSERGTPLGLDIVTFNIYVSSLEQFLFYRVSGKIAKSYIFWDPSKNTLIILKQYLSRKREAQRNIFFTSSKAKITMEANFSNIFVFLRPR